MDRWEYKYIYGEMPYGGKRAFIASEDAINALGAAGWELVGVVSDTSGDIGSTSGTNSVTSVRGNISTNAVLIFKRPKP